MRAITALALGAAVTALTACTPLHWVRPDATAEQLAQDSAHCQREAWREARLHAWHYRPLGPLPFRDAAGRRFFAWPHDPFADPFGDPFFEEGRLAQFCMRSKGYSLQPVEKPAASPEPKK